MKNKSLSKTLIVLALSCVMVAPLTCCRYLVTGVFD